MTETIPRKRGGHRPMLVTKTGRYDYSAFENGKPLCFICHLYLAAVKLVCTKCYAREAKRLANKNHIAQFDSLDVAMGEKAWDNH